MRRMGIILVFATLLIAGCDRQDKQQALLKGFYDEYLALSCPPPGECPDWVEVQRVVQRYLTPELFFDWELSHNAELDEWVDYDMFIQGQDCWPGIHVESIKRIDKTQWYEVLVAQSEMGNPEKIIKREIVFYHLVLGDDGQWSIDCIDDGFNRLGNAPADEDAILKKNKDYIESTILIIT